jgi:hypothetical protein
MKYVTHFDKTKMCSFIAFPPDNLQENFCCTVHSAIFFTPTEIELIWALLAIWFNSYNIFK